LASFQLGQPNEYIRKFKEIVPSKRYAWLLYSDTKSAEMVEAVVLDVNLAEAHAIDRRSLGSRLSS
jgi:hypothetical protein